MSETVMPTPKFYFVDEAGDPTLFASGGRVVIGSEGCSRYFVLGVLEVDDVPALSAGIQGLRARLLADPWFKRIPSMRDGAGKTAHTFHAKDDVDEVRREVFQLLRECAVRFHAVVRDKRAVLAYVRQENERFPNYRYSPDELYDSLIRLLFQDRLHKRDRCEITFSRRGTKPRTKALRAALHHARPGLPRQWEYGRDRPVAVHDLPTIECAPLQAVDYFLWATQRWFERGQSRYLEFIWPRVVLIHAVDDVKRDPRGTHYSQRSPIAFDKDKDAGI